MTYPPLASSIHHESLTHLKHHFSRILVSREFSGAIALEVAYHCLGVLSDSSKVHGLSTGGQEEESIEFLEQDSGWLMNGAQDSLTVIC
jgi:hypothetical protein